MTSTELKSNIDTNITNKTAEASLTPTQEGTQMKSIVDYIDQNVGYTVYAVLLSQSGTSAPTVKPLKNTTGATFTWDYSSAGNYTATASSGVFTNNKTVILTNLNTNGSFATGGIDSYLLSSSILAIFTHVAGSGTNGMMIDTFLEIRIYN